MTKSAADVEREVEASRGELDRTVEALKDKMTPGELFDEASRAMGGAGRQVISKLVEQAKENPMPLAVMGLGLAWLMTSTSRPYEPRSFASSASSGPGLGEKVREVGHKATDALFSAKEKLGDAVTSAGEAGRSAAHDLGSATGAAAGRAETYGRQAGRGFMDMLEREPLLIGGLAVAVGAAIGAALPSTEAEDRIVGEARDRLVEKGREAMQEGLEKAEEVAQAAYSGAKAEVENVTRGSSEADEPSGGGQPSQPFL
jgi:hypothetical protein